MPLMLHSLDVLHVNAYLVHVGLQTDVKNRLEQEEFILGHSPPPPPPPPEFPWSKLSKDRHIHTFF